MTLRIAYAQPRSGVGFQIVIDWLSQARLVTRAADGRALPSLARRWETSSDGRTWRFFLRPGLRLHDSTPLTAGTVVDALARTIDTEQASYPGLRDVISIEAPRETEVVVSLRARSSLLLEALSLESIVGENPARSRAGPFLVEEQEAGGATLRAFDGYYRGPPAIDRVTVQVFSRPRSAWAALLRNEVDSVYDVAPEAVGFLQQAAQFQMRSFLRPYVSFLGFNLEHPFLRHQDVRRALNHAVDREAIIDEVLSGQGVPASGHVPPDHWTFDRRITPFPYDPDRATELLASADEEKAQFTCLVPEGFPHLERLALLLQRQLIEVGVDMQIELVTLSELAARHDTGRFDAYVLEMAAGLNFAYWYWRSPQGDEAPFFWSGYRAADGALDRLRHAPDDETVEASVRDFQRILHNDPPGVFLSWPRVTRALSARFALPEDSDDDIFATISDWRAVDEGSEVRKGRVTRSSP